LKQYADKLILLTCRSYSRQRFKSRNWNYIRRWTWLHSRIFSSKSWWSWQLHYNWSFCIYLW